MLAVQTNSTVHSNDHVARVCPRWKTLPLKPSAALLSPIPTRKRAVSQPSHFLISIFLSLQYIEIFTIIHLKLQIALSTAQ